MIKIQIDGNTPQDADQKARALHPGHDNYHIKATGQPGLWSVTISDDETAPEPEPEPRESPESDDE